jgi:hypothetical protein
MVRAFVGGKSLVSSRATAKFVGAPPAGSSGIIIPTRGRERHNALPTLTWTAAGVDREAVNPASFRPS